MSLRLFVAVLPPPPVVAAWDTLLEPRRDADPSLRWTLPESWHVTCAFMPAVPETRLDALAEALDAVAERTPPFEVVVAGAGAFPDPDHAKALWLGVREGSDPLARLAPDLRDRLARFVREGAPGTPSLRLTPAGAGTDGFFVAVLERGAPA